MENWITTITGIIFTIDDLLAGSVWANTESLQFDLNGKHAVDEQQHVVAVMRVVGVDAELGWLPHSRHL